MGQSTGGGKGGSGQQQQGPFNFGPSAFDLQAIMNALGTSETAMTNRYNQLGMGSGGTTPAAAAQTGTGTTGAGSSNPMINQLLGWNNLENMNLPGRAPSTGDPYLDAIMRQAQPTQPTQATPAAPSTGGMSTPEMQDLGMAPSLTGGLPNMAQAMIGQMQTADVGNAAFNPALQGATSTPQTGQQNLTSLTSLANTLGGNAGTSSVLSGANLGTG